VTFEAITAVVAGFLNSVMWRPVIWYICITFRKNLMLHLHVRRLLRWRCGPLLPWISERQILWNVDTLKRNYTAPQSKDDKLNVNMYNGFRIRILNF